jgi:eukaryotic-like serine/threonine-protein kinase
MADLSAAEWQHLSACLDEALELQTHERAAWLAELQKKDAPLAARLARLLAAQNKPEFARFLLELPSLPQEEAAPAATLIGRTVGPYLIDEEIGRGGMGSVWRGRRVDGRYTGTVAIKFVHAAWIGREGEQRFRLEGQLLSRLDHPNIARLLDAGVLDGTQPYLILEYVEGEPVDTYCARHQLGLKARIRLFIDVLSAVAHAHNHLIVHRDLKPANIFVTHDGAVKLLDFGVAKLLDDELESDVAHKSVAVALTPQYAAPEQLLAQPVSTATDVYALGLVLYLLLTGTHPLSSGKRARADALRALLNEAPARASSMAALEGIPGRWLEGDLDNILNKALKKDPQERYASASAFAEDLQRFLSFQPVLARADSWRYRAAKFARRNRVALLAGGLAVSALVATSAFALVQMFEARAQRDVAVFEATHASAQSELTEFLLGDTLTQTPREVARLRLDRAGELIHHRFRTEPLLQAGLLIGLSGRYLDAGDFKEGAALMQQAEAIAQRLDDPRLNADIACGRAEDAVEAGDLATARKQAAIADRNIQRLVLVPVGLTAQCAKADAYIAQQEGDYAKAVSLMHDTMRTLERQSQQRTSTYTSIAHEYARSLSLSGDYRKAWTAEQSVLATVKDVGRDDSDAYYAMVNVGAMALIAGGQPRKALDLINTTVARSKQIGGGPELPFYLDATRLLAEAAMGSSPSAASGLMKAADTAEKVGLLSAVPVYRSSAVQAAIERGDLAAAAGDWAALSPLEAQLAAGTTRPRDAVRVLLEHSRLDLAQQHFTNAATRLNQVIALIPAGQRPVHPQWREIVLLRAEIEYALGDYSSAAHDAQAAVDRARAEAVDPQSSAWIGEALAWRARAEAALGNSRSAAATAQEALTHLSANLDGAHPAIALARATLIAGQAR